MSTRVMSACWPVKTEPSRKAVLISLADQANDDGICWPSVGSIADRTCLDERTVQRAISDLQDEGHLTVQMRTGRSTVYRVHPRHGDTPVTVTPPSESHPTPVTVTPHPRHGDTQNRKGTVKEPNGASRAVLPPEIPEDVWRDWDAYRRARKGWTAKARELSVRTLLDLQSHGQDLRACVDNAIERGWAKVYPIRQGGSPRQDDLMTGAL